MVAKVRGCDFKTQTFKHKPQTNALKRSDFQDECFTPGGHDTGWWDAEAGQKRKSYYYPPIRSTQSLLNYLSRICIRSTPNSRVASLTSTIRNPNTANDPLPTAINRNKFWSQPMARKRARARAKWIVIASVLLMFHLQGWPCDCYSLLMPEQIKAMSRPSPPPPPHRAKDTGIIALLAYLPRWCMAPIASQYL